MYGTCLLLSGTRGHESANARRLGIRARPCKFSKSQDAPVTTHSQAGAMLEVLVLAQFDDHTS